MERLTAIRDRLLATLVPLPGEVLPLYAVRAAEVAPGGSLPVAGVTYGRRPPALPARPGPIPRGPRRRPPPAACGAANPLRPALRLRLAEPVTGRPGRARLLWSRLEAGGLVRPVEREASQVRGPALANLLLALPAEAGELPAGTEVTAWWLDDGA